MITIQVDNSIMQTYKRDSPHKEPTCGIARSTFEDVSRNDHETFELQLSRNLIFSSFRISDFEF